MSNARVLTRVRDVKLLPGSVVGFVSLPLGLEVESHYEYVLTIESNVTVRSDTTKEQLNATGMLYLFLIRNAFCFEVWCVAVQNVDVGGVDIDM